MNRIIYGSSLAPSLFEENVHFTEDRSYTISIKRFESDEITIPHYASTFEILVCGEVSGEVTIEKTRFNEIGNTVFAISPYCVHSMKIKRCAGTIFVLKCSLDKIGHFINLAQFAKYSEIDINTLTLCGKSEVFERINSYVICMVENDGNLFVRMINLLNIFSVLVDAMTMKTPRGIAVQSGSELKNLIDWTEKNYSSHISIEDAAGIVGYNKYHFCHWFKNAVNMTYLEYLTQVRVIKATHLLIGNIPVGEVSIRCGYENVSHFIRQFKKIFGCTPKKYLEKRNNNMLP